MFLSGVLDEMQYTVPFIAYQLVINSMIFYELLLGKICGLGLENGCGLL